jgi:hypothetical protein
MVGEQFCSSQQHSQQDKANHRNESFSEFLKMVGHTDPCNQGHKKVARKRVHCFGTHVS